MSDVTLLIERLSAPDVKVRSNAAFQLGNKGPQAETALPALLNALQDVDRSVRKAVLWALRRITLNQSQLLSVYHQVLTNPDEDETLRSEAGRCLMDIGENAVPLLCETARTGDSLGRFTALGQLGSMFPGVGEDCRLQIVEAFLHTLGDEVDTVQWRARRGLENAAQTNKQIFRDALNAERPMVRAWAARVLLRADPEDAQAVLQLVRELQCPDSTVRRVAAEGLASAGEDAAHWAVDSLLAALCDRDVEVSWRAAWALSQVPALAEQDVAVPRLLAGLRHHRDWDVRRWICVCLARYEKAAGPALEVLLEVLGEYLEDLEQWELDWMDEAVVDVGFAVTQALANLGNLAQPALPLLRKMRQRARDQEFKHIARHLGTVIKRINARTK